MGTDDERPPRGFRTVPLALETVARLEGLRDWAMDPATVLPESLAAALRGAHRTRDGRAKYVVGLAPFVAIALDDFCALYGVPSAPASPPTAWARVESVSPSDPVGRAATTRVVEPPIYDHSPKVEDTETGPRDEAVLSDAASAPSPRRKRKKT